MSSFIGFQPSKLSVSGESLSCSHPSFPMLPTKRPAPALTNSPPLNSGYYSLLPPIKSLASLLAVKLYQDSLTLEYLEAEGRGISQSMRLTFRGEIKKSSSRGNKWMLHGETTSESIKRDASRFSYHMASRRSPNVRKDLVHGSIEREATYDGNWSIINQTAGGLGL